MDNVNGDLVERAFQRYFLDGNDTQPAKAASGLETHDGKSYIVLRNTYGTLAVFAVRGTRLHALPEEHDWPAAIVNDEQVKATLTACKKHKVKITDWRQMAVRCEACGQEWYPNAQSGGKLPRGWWKCPKACND